MQPKQIEKYDVKRVCCVCKKDLGIAAWKADEPGRKTHGYCDPCGEKEIAAVDEMIKKAGG